MYFIFIGFFHRVAQPVNTQQLSADVTINTDTDFSLYFEVQWKGKNRLCVVNILCMSYGYPCNKFVYYFPLTMSPA